MLPAGLSLLAGLAAGLNMLGLPSPVTGARLPAVHGMLLVLGFVGTLIALERATALARWYGYAAPALLGAGGICLVIDAVPLQIGQTFLVLGSAALALVYVPLWRRRFDAPILVQALGAAMACGGAILWLGGAEMPRVLPWLFVFVVLTIIAERVELASITMGPHAASILSIFSWMLVLTVLIGTALPDVGAVAMGVVLLALVGWAVQADVARRTIRLKGSARFMAACILGGYFWLAVAGVVLLFGSPTSRPLYDAAAHAVFLGFTISMILAHSTTILPAVLHVALPYNPVFWVAAVVLHLSLVVRLWFGDGFDLIHALQFGGTLGVIALLLFVATALASAVFSRPILAAQRRRRSAARHPNGQANDQQNDHTNAHDTMTVNK